MTGLVDFGWVGRVLTLDGVVFQEIRESKGGLGKAFFAFLLSFFLGNWYVFYASFSLLGSSFYPVVLLALLVLLATSGFVHLTAVYVFYGKDKFQEFLRMWLYSFTPMLLGIVPLLIILVLPLIAISLYRTMKQAYHLNNAKTIVLVLISLITPVVIAFGVLIFLSVLGVYMWVL